MAVLAVTSVFMKLNWYDRLEKAPPPEPQGEAPVGAVAAAGDGRAASAG
jgi:hypothetical protein